MIFFKKYLIFCFLGILIAIGFAFIGFEYLKIAQKSQELKIVINEFLVQKQELEKEIEMSEIENAQLAELLLAEKERNDNFERQVRAISSTVGILEKLSQTDKELLQKYSKVYFLNENYVPSNLAKIDTKYVFEKNKESLIHSNVQKYLYQMLDDAEFNGYNILTISAYRSFGEQTSLKTGYVTTYGSGANRFSADQGYSEHQLGTAIDFTTSKIGSNFTKIESEPDYEWLLENAHRYGFVLSYPKGNAYYQFEPWHWRFVGKNLAGELKRRQKYFYDIDQREIDTYLISIFD